MSKLIAGFVLGAALASAWWGLAVFGAKTREGGLAIITFSITIGCVIGLAWCIVNNWKN